MKFMNLYKVFNLIFILKMDGVEIGLESISSQIGTAVLDVQDGRIVRV